MEFTFETTELRAICENRKKATQLMGQEAALALEHRLADLRAVETAAEFYELFLDEVSPLADGATALTLTGGWKVKFYCAHVRAPLLDDGELDWARVTRIRIIGVEQ